MRSFELCSRDRFVICFAYEIATLSCVLVEAFEIFI
jgi:hypothetical protein